MINYDGEIIEFDYVDVADLMQQASMVIMGTVREVQKTLPDVPTDFLVQDLFKSLRFAALLEDGKTEEQALQILNGDVETQPEIVLE